MVATKREVEVQLEELLGDVKREVDISRRRRIFCNRNLRMESIELIGFDMDYTLALYRQDQMEQLSIDLTLGKLIENRGYSPEIRDLDYDPRYAIRGLVVDRKTGNVFKMDRHSYVGRCYHGLQQLDTESRRQLYRHKRINLSHRRYTWIDTLFGLPEAVMYMVLVDHFDRQPGGCNYSKLFDDIRASIDEAHRDDTLKSVIKQNVADYIVKDPQLAETLHKLRSSGKKLFLLTNSLYDYTDVVMSYLLDGERSAYGSWRNYFDVVIVGGQKPAFFTERQPFRLVDPATHELLPAQVTSLGRDRVYQGGNIFDFEDMTGVRGERVLYIGDHIYGDILRLRKAHMWRTAMVVQELDEESASSEMLEEQIKDLTALDRRRRNLDSEIDYQVLKLKRLQRVLEQAQLSGQTAILPRLNEVKKQSKEVLDSLRERARRMHEECDALEESIERSFNPHWGPIFREGNENSRFGKQVSDYADLYTSRVSNFLSYSPLRYFRAPRMHMPHEL